MSTPDAPRALRPSVDEVVVEEAAPDEDALELGVAPSREVSLFELAFDPEARVYTSERRYAVADAVLHGARRGVDELASAPSVGDAIYEDLVRELERVRRPLLDVIAGGTPVGTPTGAPDGTREDGGASDHASEGEAALPGPTTAEAFAAGRAWTHARLTHGTPGNRDALARLLVMCLASAEVWPRQVPVALRGLHALAALASRAASVEDDAALWAVLAFGAHEPTERG